MSVSKTFTDWAVKLHALTAQSAAAVYISGITEQAMNQGLQSQTEAADGSEYASYGFLSEGAPVGRFSTVDLKAFLDECGASGMKIDADGTHPGVVMYFQRNKQGSTREARDASNHIAWTIANGILVPRTLELPHRGVARLSVEALARKESSTAPVAIDTTADLPAGVYPAISALHGIGPVDLNGTTVDGLRNVSIEFGLDVAVEAADGDTYPTFVTIAGIRPVFTLQGVHPDIVGTLTVDGAYYSASQVIVYAKKRSEGTTWVANGTTGHLSFTLGKCRVDPQETAPKSVNLRITPWATPGGSPVTPVTINTNTTIP